MKQSLVKNSIQLNNEIVTNFDQFLW